MELEKTGKAGTPAVLLLTDRVPEDTLIAMKGLEKNYTLLAAPADAPAEELEAALLAETGGLLWGAYGLHAGGDALLRLLARDRVRIRTAVLEGAFTMPEILPDPRKTRVICWIGGKDKAAKKSWQGLGERVAPVDSLTVKKLPKKESLLSFRPDVAAAQLKKAFGTAVCVQRSCELDQSPERVWRYLREYPAYRERSLLTSHRPVERMEEARIQLLEGSSDKLTLWIHATHVEERDGKTLCIDRIELEAGKRNAAARPLAELYLALLQLQRARGLKKS